MPTQLNPTIRDERWLREHGHTVQRIAEAAPARYHNYRHWFARHRALHGLTDGVLEFGGDMIPGAMAHEMSAGAHNLINMLNGQYLVRGQTHTGEVQWNERYSLFTAQTGPDVGRRVVKWYDREDYVWHSIATIRNSGELRPDETPDDGVDPRSLQVARELMRFLSAFVDPDHTDPYPMHGVSIAHALDADELWPNGLELRVTRFAPRCNRCNGSMTNRASLMFPGLCRDCGNGLDMSLTTALALGQLQRNRHAVLTAPESPTLSAVAQTPLAADQMWDALPEDMPPEPQPPERPAARMSEIDPRWLQ